MLAYHGYGGVACVQRHARAALNAQPSGERGDGRREHGDTRAHRLLSLSTVLVGLALHVGPAPDLRLTDPAERGGEVVTGGELVRARSRDSQPARDLSTGDESSSDQDERE